LWFASSNTNAKAQGNPWTVATATAPADKVLYQRQIDALVYALYGLTEEEIEIVEQASRQ